MSQVNKINRIVIASVLKPVDEPRMFEKFGVSLLDSGLFDVHIIGFPSTLKFGPSLKIHLHPLTQKPFHRLSWKRLTVSFLFLKKVLSIRPGYLIITTHELLFPAIFCWLFMGCRLYYDVQENYFRNILYTNAFPFPVRQVLALWVRLKEKACSPFIHHFILAEKAYAHELPFAKPHIVLENKLTRLIANNWQKKSQTGYTNLLFSGTLAESTGVYEAINIVMNLQRLDPAFNLTIIGHCPLGSDFKKLQQLSDQYSFIRFAGKRYPVPHHEILYGIKNADFGLICFPPNPSTEGSVPTKLYQYMALQLPVLIRHNSESHKLATENKAGIVLDQPIHYPALLDQLKSFTRPNGSPHLFWDSDFHRFLEVVNK